MARAFRDVTQLFVSGDLSQPARAQLIAAQAETAVAALISTGRASPIYTRAVDGVIGADPAQLRPGGTIAYTFSYLGMAAAFALSFLQARSPFGPKSTGPRTDDKHFRDSFFVGVDGRFLSADEFAPASVTAAAKEIIIGNTQPYDRKVDVQLEGGRVLHFSVAAGLYLDAVSAVKRQFGIVVTAKRLSNVNFPEKIALLGGSGSVQTPALVLNPLQ